VRSHAAVLDESEKRPTLAVGLSRHDFSLPAVRPQSHACVEDPGAAWLAMQRAETKVPEPTRPAPALSSSGHDANPFKLDVPESAAGIRAAADPSRRASEKKKGAIARPFLS